MKILRILFALSLLSGCASMDADDHESVPSSDRLAGVYDRSSGTYSNLALGFRIKLPLPWMVYESETKLPAEARAFAANIRENGGEMFLFAHNVEQSIFLRGISEETGLELETYAQKLEEANRRELLPGSKRELIRIGGRPAIRWIYDTSLAGNLRVRFCEYQFRRDRFNVRMSFWTLPSNFAAGLKIYEEIMKSYSE